MPRSPAPAHGSWALVVTGDEVLRARAVEGLGAAGLSCDTPATGSEAISWIEGLRRAYTILVVDLELPDLPAREVETIAAIMMPEAPVVRCGPGAPRPAGGRGFAIAKPALSSEFARFVGMLRLKPADGDSMP